MQCGSRYVKQLAEGENQKNREPLGKERDLVKNARGPWYSEKSGDLTFPVISECSRNLCVHNIYSKASFIFINNIVRQSLHKYFFGNKSNISLFISPHE